MYGIMMHAINFVMMIVANFLLIHFDIKASFIFFAIFLAITLFMYKKFDKEHLPIIHKED